MPLVVAPALPHEYAAAARMLYAHEPEPERTQHAARFSELVTAGKSLAAGLFVARDVSGAIRGAMLAQTLPGGLGVACPPRGAAEDALAAAACDWLRGRGVKVCQAFVSAADRPAMAPLERHGFLRVTSVTHFRRDLGPSDAHSLVEPAFRAYAPHNRTTFLRTLLATYDGSLDCPELNGSRTPDELLDAFGDPDAGGWFLVMEAGESVGVVMLGRGSDADVIEIAYLGLAPAARGRGLGGQLVRFAIDAARADGSNAVTLSVDVRNEPALRLYRRHGFAECDRQDVYLADWPAAAAE